MEDQTLQLLTQGKGREVDDKSKGRLNNKVTREINSWPEKENERIYF